jgi:hypothetical protein
MRLFSAESPAQVKNQPPPHARVVALFNSEQLAAAPSHPRGQSGKHSLHPAFAVPPCQAWVERTSGIATVQTTQGTGADQWILERRAARQAQPTVVGS